MGYTCDICKTDFLSEALLQKHYGTKRHKNREDNKLKYDYVCKCGKSFTKQPNLSRHRKNCKIYNAIDSIDMVKPIIVHATKIVEEKDKQIENQQTQINELRKQIALLLENGTNNTTNSNNNIDNATHFNITVNSFGNENTDYLTDKIICKLIQTAPFTCIPQLIEKIHFDPEHPENHNIKVTNKKLNYAEVVQDNKWITTNKKKAIDNIIQNSYNLLDEKYTEKKESMSEKRKDRFENFQDKYENQEDDLMRNIKNDVDLTLINGTNNIHK
jgi:F0F1-type ATP synthase membrane subunit b/b'